ncbi:MAG: GNAT family N-acetyltransferase [Acetobacteraceae bacterium]|nr:GNAT family N-acetyltransferase [Acetobacteraceae bacterium]
MLEARAPSASIFQRWGWVGCLAEERYKDPVLIRATNDSGDVIGLALFNHRAGQLYLAESGDSRLDAPYIEHNAPLVAEGPQAGAIGAALLDAAWRVRGVRRLVLHGVPPAVQAAAGGVPWRLHEDTAPHVDLAALPPGSDWLASLSANTRYQIRRSDRRFAALGDAPPEARAAATETEAQDWLEAMAALHGETWRRRGKTGAFADPFALRFHKALVARMLARGELDLLRITAGPELVIGYLYNFRRGGRVYAYQSGFRAAAEGSHEKPGLTCHALAIQRAQAAGDRCYDFLAGAHRYKLSLANGSARLVWAELVPSFSPHGVVARAVHWWRRRGAA